MRPALGTRQCVNLINNHGFDIRQHRFRRQQRNFDAYQGMRIFQTPQIVVRGLENGAATRGIGEPGVPPAAPALGNAIFAATGQRIRELPFSKHIAFV